MKGPVLMKTGCDQDTRRQHPMPAMEGYCHASARVMRPGVLGLVLAGMFVLGQAVLCINMSFAADQYNKFEQSDWRGGASADNATDPANKTGWTKYSSAGANVDTVSSAGVKLLPNPFSLTDDTDADFAEGSGTNTIVAGTGSAATLGLNTVYQDPFCSALGEWANLPFTPYMGAVAPLTRAGNYIYSLWVSWGNNMSFMRWSIADEKWEMMADIPMSVGLGAALAYDGNDVIYALVGGNRKEFYAYQISTNTWYAKKNISAAVGYGGALVVVPSISKAFAFCGNGSSVFYRYNIPTGIAEAGSWSAVESTPFAVGIGASLVYPGSGNLVYGSAGGGSTSFAKFDVNASSNAWVSLQNCPFALSWYSDVVWPGTGDYLYAWNGGSRYFARYYISSDTWESSYYTSTLSKDIEMPALPFTIYSRMYLYDPDGGGTELRLLSNHSYSSTYRYYPATKKWREESYPRSSGYWGADAVYVASENAIYYIPGNGYKYFYKYYLTFTPFSSSNTAVAYQWERLSDATFAGNTSGIYVGGGLAYKPGDTYIYCMQGYYQNGFSRYNLTTKAWEQLAPLPQKAYWGGTLVVAGNFVYATGGYNQDTGAYTNNLYRYKPQNDTWQSISLCPFGNFYYGACSVYPGSGDYIYFLRSNSRTVFMTYQISTDTWTQKANLPDMYPGYGGKFVYSSSENAIYYLNGHDGSLYYTGFAKYDIATNTWQSLHAPIFQYTQIAACASDTNLYHIGTQYASGVETYVFSTGQWKNEIVNAPYATSRLNFGSVVKKGDYVYLFMNYRTNYAWKYSLTQNKWVNLIKLPFVTSGTGHRAVYPGTGDYIYVSEGNMSRNFWKYNTATGTWTQLASSPYMFFWSARMVADASGIYVCPGYYNSSIFLKFNDDAYGGSWTTLPNMLESAYSEGNGMCIISSGSYKGIYVLKQSGTTKFTKFNLDDETWGYLADAPWAISDYGSLVYPGSGDFIYCLKGSGRDFAKYSLSTNTWTILTDASISVGGTSGGFYPGTGDLLYFYLGVNHGNLGVNFNRYSISTNRWDEPIQFPASNSYGSQICAMPSGEEIFYMRGGSNEFYKYNITNSVWYTLNPPPSSVTTDARAVYPGSGDYIYVTRGTGYYDIWAYSVSTDLWTNLAVPPATFSTGQTLAYRDGYLYAMRGGSTITFWRYSIAGNNWKEYATTPTVVSRGSNLINPGTDKYLYATAGGGSVAFWRYNADTTDTTTTDGDSAYNTWESLAPLPLPSMGGVLFSPGFGDYIYYFVSYNYDLSYGTNYFYRYCISTNTWDTRPDLPFVLNGQAAAMYPGTGDYIYLSSGYGTSSLMKYLLFSSGIYISDIKEIGNNASLANVSWVNNGLGQIDIKVRTGKKFDLSDALAWSYVDKTVKNADLSAYAGVNDGDQYLQYYIRFFCYDLTQVPLMDKVTIGWTKYPLSQELVSSPYNTTYATNRLRNISWTATLPAGTDVRFQVHTAPDDNGEPGTWGPWYGPAGIQQIPYEFTNKEEYANTSEVVVSNGTAKLSKVLQDYLYRQKVIIDNTSGATAYTDCTIRVEVPSANIDFWNHISSDGSDIRFVDSDGKTPLKYRVVGFSKNKKTATCWVTVPTIPLGAAKTIYILYGKSTATTESDPTLAESLIGTDFYAFMFAFFDIVTTDAPNRVTIEKLDSSGQVIASSYRDFTAVGEKQRYDDTDLTVYHVTSQKPITIFTSAIEPASYYDDDFYTVCGNDLWLWMPSNNYDGDVIITAYNDDTQVTITDYGLGDDTQSIALDKGNFWFGWNRVDSRGEVWHIEATKPITVMAGLINHGEASEQIRSPDMQEYYFYCPDSIITLTAYEDGTNIIIDNLDSTTGDYSGTLNKGQSYKHLPNGGTGALSMRTYVSADKPICVVADDSGGGKGQIYQSADTLVGVGKEYYINTAATRYLRLVALEDGGTSVTITGDISPSPSYVSLGSKGSSTAVDPGATWRNLQVVGDKRFALYTYNSYSEAITPVFKIAEFNYRMSTYMLAEETAATSGNPQLSAWQYKETLNIDNTANDAALADFQVSVDIDKSHKDFWSHVKSDGSDVRFVDSDDTTLLPYYLDTFSTTEQKARFWIKLPTLSNTAKQTVYMYYGNPAAVSQSNGDNVFEFFDSFDGGLDKWDTQYCNLVTVSSIFGMDSSTLTIATGTTTPSTDVVIPSGIISGRTYDWNWELRWANGALVQAQDVVQPFTLYYGLVSMTAGPFMVKSVVPGQVISTLGGTFTNNETYDQQGLKLRFKFTDVDSGAVFDQVDSTTFDLPHGATTTINNASITMPAGLIQGHLYYWSWQILNSNNNVILSSDSAPAALFNIQVGFEMTTDPTLPEAPLVGGTTRSVSATFSNNSGISLNNLIWRFILTDTSQGGRTAVKVAHNGYLQAKTNMAPNYNITSQVIWQTANKTGQHFVGICDPNAKYATSQGTSSYLAGYNVLMWNNGYFYDESGDGYTSWESIRMAYTATMWNTEKMTWTPHNPGGTPPTSGKVVFELSSGDKLTYNAGFVAGPNLSIKPTVRSAKDAIFIDKFMVYKSATVAPYVGFVYSETANPTGMEVYYKTNPTIQPILGVFYDNNLVDFTDVITTPTNTSIKYQVSSDGYNWYWHDGTKWTLVSAGLNQANTSVEIRAHLVDYVTAFPKGEFWYRVYLSSSDGVYTPELDKVTITTTTDPTYYVAPAGSLINVLNRDAEDDQWFQYRVLLSSVGQDTPILTKAGVEYIKSFITVTAPNGGETINSGSTATITWNAQAIDGNTGKVKIQYSTDNGATYPNTIVSNLNNTGTYSWLVPDNPSQTAKIKIVSEDFPLVYDESDASFRILSLEVSSPNGGEIWEVGKPHGITWFASGTLAHDLTIKYSINGGTTWSLVSNNRPPSPAIYTWTVANTPSDTVSLRIYDPLNENITDTSNQLFAIVPAPKITVNSPVQGDVWKEGLTKTLSWTANQNWFCPTVDIEYSNDDFISDVHAIAAGVSIGTPVGSNPNDDINGSYNWTVPSAFSDSMKIRVKESALPADRNGQPRDTQLIIQGLSGVFTIAAPTVTFTAPVSSDVLVAGENFRVIWITDGTISNDLLLEYSKDGSTWTTIATGVSNENKYYDWMVPQDAVGDSVLIKITDNSNPQVTATSPAVQILGYPAIKVLAPNGTENLVIGETFNIKWKSWGAKLQSGGSDYQAIRLLYSDDNGVTWTEINSQQVNDGDYPWEIPDAESSQCLVKVEDASDTQISDVSDAVFTITIPSVTVITPNGGESWFATGNYNVTWTSRGYVNPDSLLLEYSTDGATWNTIKSGQANTGTYTWKVADVLSSTVRVRITDAQRTTVTDTSNNPFTIKAPTITVVSPNNGTEEWVAGLVKEIKWTSEGYDVGAVRDNINIRYSADGGTSWLDTNLPSGSANSGSYMWLVPSTISNTCLVKIYDASRPATVDTSDQNFKIVLPYVRVLTPNGGESWPIGTKDKVITFRSVGDISNNLKIEYSKDNFTSDFHTIATGVSKGELQEDGSFLGSYGWGATGDGIPDDYSSSVKVRVTDSNWLAIHDESDNFFTIAYPILKVTRPNGGDLFTVGDAENITWTNTGSVGNSLKIEYSKDNFVTDGILIADNVPNSGEGGTYSWTVVNDISATARVRITDNSRPLMVNDKSDATFSILPTPVITIDKPNGSEIWRVGTNQNITWHDNGGVISNNLTLEYSNDVGATWKTIAAGVANTGGYVWKVPDDVLGGGDGTKTYLVRITDISRPTTTDVSDDVFTIAPPKITITSPNGGEIWAISDKAPVTWTSEGAVSDSLSLEVSCSGGAEGTFVSLATVTNSGAYLWEIKDDKVTVTSNAIFRIRDITRPATYDISDKSFTIDPLPTITIMTPTGTGEVYVLGDTTDVTWTWTGLSISNNLIIDISLDNFATHQIIASGVPNSGKFVWNIPDSTLTGTTLRLRITDGNRTLITDTTDGTFRIRGGFTVITPNGGENWVAKSPQAITWSTRGYIPKVNLDYTTDGGLNWTTIVAGLTNSNSYTWTLPDIKSSTVKVRVSNQDDTTVNDMSEEAFNIIYASVKFNVLDFDTFQHLSELSAEEPATAWSTGYELTSPVTRTAQYPYGTYTTFFKKDGFIDNSVSWTAPKTGTDPYVVTLYMESTASAQVSWEAIATYSYAPADDSLSAVGSLQRKGKLVGTRAEERAQMGAATFTIYESDGATLRKELITTVNDSGMYVFPIYANTDFQSGKVYPATLTILYNDVAYTSTANIDVGSEKLQYEFFTQTATQLADSVEKIEQAVGTGLAKTEGVLKDKISSSEEAIKAHTTSTVAATEKKLDTSIDEAKTLTETAMKSEILNRENTVRSGQDLMIRYRTYSGLSPVIDVYDANNVQRVSKGAMMEIGATGIYEYDLTFVLGWGTGDFTIVCSESSYGTLDALTLTVRMDDLESVASDLSAVLGSVSPIKDMQSKVEAFSAAFHVVEQNIQKASEVLAGVKGGSEAILSASKQMETVHRVLQDMSDKIHKMSTSTDMQNIERLYEVSEKGAQNIDYLRNKTQELKALMLLNQKMVENVAKEEPVVQTWYEYS
ncbi:DUF2341 domain-containing protein [Candidatus Velamenicoccus archaeovorus]|nr:DUF2341 domain-containing protein [Candidatus Velamenicoccus archaeovorus]